MEDGGETHITPSDVSRVEAFARENKTSVLVAFVDDIVGSSALKDQLGELGFQRVLAEHDRLLNDIIKRGSVGDVVKSTGDGVLAVFAEPSTAVQRALEIQENLLGHPYLKVRIGLDMGQVRVESEGGVHRDMFGRHVDWATRAESMAEGGHIIVTRSVYTDASGWIPRTEVAWKEHGSYVVKEGEPAIELFEAYNANITQALETVGPEGKRAPQPTVVEGEKELVESLKDQLKKWKSGETLRISIPASQPEYIVLVGMRLDEHLEAAGVDPEFQAYAQTAFTELVENALEHGCRGLDEGAVDVTIELNDAFFAVAVKDPGPGFAANETIEKIKKEPPDRERRRGLMQVSTVTDSLTFSGKGDEVRAVIFRRKEGGGIRGRKMKGIQYVEVRGKGDLALVNAFSKWIADYSPGGPEKLLLKIHSEWVSSSFIGCVAGLQGKVKELGGALAVWVQHKSCYDILMNLGLISFVSVYRTMRTAEAALKHEAVDVLDEVDDEEGPGSVEIDGERVSGIVVNPTKPSEKKGSGKEEAGK